MIIILLLNSCTSKKEQPAITWLYGYGQVEKLKGRVKKLAGKNFAYTFDKKGNLVAIEDLFKNSKDATKYSTVYKNGVKSEAVGLYFDSGKKIKEVYKYNDQEQITRCILNANNPPEEPDHFLYSIAGELVEHRQYFEKKPLWIFKYKYFYGKDSLCTGVEQSMTTWRDNFKNASKDTTKYISFDSKGNWIKAVNFLNDTVTRKITYY